MLKAISNRFMGGSGFILLTRRGVFAYDGCVKRLESRCGARVLFLAFAAAIFLCPAMARAQVNYEVHFQLEKTTGLLGEPVFVDFTIRNTGATPFSFSYRLPIRAANPELESEPRITVTDASGRPLRDPAPQPCGGAKGSVVYGSSTLSPGATHTERWLVNEWARFTSPGTYRIRAERRLPIYEFHPPAETFTKHPAAYALALDQLSIQILPAGEKQLKAAFAPYVKSLKGPAGAELNEAVLVISTLPNSFLFAPLAAFAERSANSSLLREKALEGLARLGTPAAWRAISGVAVNAPATSGGKPTAGEQSLISYAILLLGEKGDPAFLPPIIRLLKTAPPSERANILQTLGYFHDPRASQALIDNLHAADSTDRINAILGLKNLGNKDVIPSLLAALNDPEAQVRAVANFALENLTGQKFDPGDTPQALAAHWHDWWLANNAAFEPQPSPPCQDW